MGEWKLKELGHVFTTLIRSFCLDKIYVLPDENKIYLYIFLAVFLIIFGIINFLFPRLSWRLKLGWRAKDSEPSDAVLIITRIIGIVAIIIGVYLLFVSGINIAKII